MPLYEEGVGEATQEIPSKLAGCNDAGFVGPQVQDDGELVTGETSDCGILWQCC